MHVLFDDILNTDGVKGVMLFGPNGDLLFKEFSVPLETAPEKRDWRFIIESLEGMRVIPIERRLTSAVFCRCCSQQNQAVNSGGSLKNRTARCQSAIFNERVIKQNEYRD